MIVVAGDITIDCFETTTPAFPLPKTGEPPVWQTCPQLHAFTLPGDTLLLAEFVRAATGCTVLAPSVAVLDDVHSPGVLRAHFRIDRFPSSTQRVDDGKCIYRIREYNGFVGPSQDSVASHAVQDDGSVAQLIVLEDAGNEFRDVPAAWPSALRAADAPTVLYKAGRPIGRGQLWTSLLQQHVERMVVVLNVEDLRREGVNISRRLSWERTATNLVWQLRYNPRLATLRDCACLIVRIGVDGAVVCPQPRGGVQASLIFDPEVAEEGSADLYPGRMRGLGAAFTAALAAHLAHRGLQDIADGVRTGLRAAQRLLRFGYGDALERLGYPGAELFRARQENEPALVNVPIPPAHSADSPDPDFWCMVNDCSPDEIEQASCEHVVHGTSALLERFPVGSFGELRTVDRSEIESYSSIQNLIREYLSATTTHQPISIAVFGPPGSGKSFGVTQVAESVAPGRLKTLGFNLAQFSSLDELSAAFHRVRDVTLGGKLPFVFFDEFDSDFHGKLGWLKYFLAPMQDGRFRDREGTHPTGRAIFVFAGGTSSTFAEFARNAETRTTDAGSARDPTAQAFRDAKGSDFISRLRGYVNTRGIDQAGEHDHLYKLRRALIVRVQLRHKAGHLFTSNGVCQIDRGVLRALLGVPAYRHGVRSLSAILDMSMLAGRKRFERASLPSAEQLELHVDSRAFLRAVMQDVLDGPANDLPDLRE